MPTPTHQLTRLHDLLGDPTTLEPSQIVKRLQIADVELWRHAVAVAGYVKAMASMISTSTSSQHGAIVDAAWLHDIGKLTLRREVMLKAGPLSENEWSEMRLHPARGANYLQQSTVLGRVASIVRHHHEWYDGCGYPDGLRGRKIELGARLIGVADAYDAMTSWRPYRPTLPDEDAIAELQRCAGTQFDPESVELFIRATVGLRPKADR